jgi:hypothetical protein
MAEKDSFPLERKAKFWYFHTSFFGTFVDHMPLFLLPKTKQEQMKIMN